tara:strand:+ start:296 stop:571 length:276 start_codon:yes stop_codon:yes gene_type:complete
MTTEQQIQIKKKNPAWSKRFKELQMAYMNFPHLLSGKRVNEILDIGNTTRFYLHREGKLQKIKLGDKIQSQAKYTKDSVLALIVDWEINAK